MPRKKIAADVPPNDAPEAPSFDFTITGPLKGHPPITITGYGRNAKEAMNAIRWLLASGKLTIA